MKHTRLACRVLTALIILTLTTVAQEEKTPVAGKDKEGEWLIFGNNEFALAMYAKVAAAQKGNFCFSPYSTMRSQAILYAASKKDTAAQIKSIMKLQLPVSQLHTGMARLQKRIALDAGPKTTHLLGANAIWPRSGAPLNGNFLKTLQDAYGIAKVQPLDFAQKPDIALERINNGAFLATNQIETVISKNQFDPKSELILTEAVYFCAPWRYRFVNTGKDQPFTANGKTVKVPMMTQTARLSYGDFKEFDLLELPMKSPKFVVQILIPKEGKTLGDVESKLAVYNFYEWGAGLKDAKVTVNLPRLDLETSFDVANVLKSLGMKDAFDPAAANFSNLTSEKLTLSHIYQKAQFSLATTGAKSPRVSLGRAKLPEVKLAANRPFVFIAKHKPTNSILLMGRISEPAEK